MAVLELIYNPTSPLAYQDRMMVPVAAPSVFGAIQQVQQLAAQRAEADAIGRQSLANALRHRQVLAMQNRLLRDQLASQHALAGLSLQQQKQQQALDALRYAQAQALAERELSLKERQLEEGLRAAKENELMREIQQARKEASALALAQLDAEEQRRKEARDLRLSALQSILQQQDVGAHAEHIPALMIEIARLSSDRTPLITIAKTLKAKAEQQQATFEALEDAARRSTEAYQEALFRLISENRSRLRKAIAERQPRAASYAGQGHLASFTYERSADELLDNILKTRDVLRMHDLVTSLGAHDILRQAQAEAARQLETVPSALRAYLTYTPAGIRAIMPRPLNPQLIERWLDEALQTKPAYQELSPLEKYRISIEAAEAAAKPLSEALEKLRREPSRVLTTPIGGSGRALPFVRK